MKRRPRGILSFVDGPLCQYPYDEAALQETTHLLRNHRAARKKNDATDRPAPCRQEYDHSRSEFTLFFFAESSCLNSIRFRPVLARFVAKTKKDDKPCCQCICVPDTSRVVDRLCSGTGFWCLPLDYGNRAAIVRCVPRRPSEHNLTSVLHCSIALL